MVVGDTQSHPVEAEMTKPMVRLHFVGLGPPAKLTFGELVTNLRNALFSCELKSFSICQNIRMTGCWSKPPF